MKKVELVGEIRDLDVLAESGIPVARTSLRVVRDGNIVTISLASSKLAKAYVKLTASSEIQELIQIVNGDNTKVLRAGLVQDGGWIRVDVFKRSRMISLEFPPGRYTRVQVDRTAFKGILARI